MSHQEEDPGTSHHQSSQVMMRSMTCNHWIQGSRLKRPSKRPFSTEPYIILLNTIIYCTRRINVQSQPWWSSATQRITEHLTQTHPKADVVTLIGSADSSMPISKVCSTITLTLAHQPPTPDNLTFAPPLQPKYVKERSNKIFSSQ